MVVRIIEQRTPSIPPSTLSGPFLRGPSLTAPTSYNSHFQSALFFDFRSEFMDHDDLSIGNSLFPSSGYEVASLSAFSALSALSLYHSSPLITLSKVPTVGRSLNWIQGTISPKRLPSNSNTTKHLPKCTTSNLRHWGQQTQVLSLSSPPSIP